MIKPGYDINDVEQANGVAALSEVAHMYYDLHMSQPEIARRLYFSRSKVSRMLKRAEELGIVQIQVRRFVSRMPNIERKLESLFSLKKALVLSSFDEGDRETRESLANFAARYLSDRFEGECVFGITGGRTVTQVVRKLTRERDCAMHVVQIIGASPNKYMSGELVNAVATVYGGKPHYLNTPLYVDDLYVKEILLRDPAVSDTLSLMAKCDVILTGLGEFSASGDMPHWHGYMMPRHRQEMERQGAVGSVCAQFFDHDGRALDCEWNRKCIAIPWSDFRACGMRAGVAAGDAKVLPILAALRGELLDVLITDSHTASRVIEHEHEQEQNDTEKR